MFDDLPIVDAHHHLWDLDVGDYPWLNGGETVRFRYGDYSAIRRTYLYDDYRRDSAGHNVVKSVHMEAEWNPADPVGETRWLTAYAEGRELPSAIVAQAWLDRDDVEAVLTAQASFDLVRSVRQKPKAAPRAEDFSAAAPGSMADTRFRAGYALLGELGLSYDLQTPWWHLGEAADLAGDFPNTQIILNHAGLPSDRSVHGLAGWRDAMRGLAQVPNVAVKISGIGVPGQAWTVAANRAIVLDVIEAFGVKRCLFASNFPVDGLCAAYTEIFDGFKTITADFSAADRLKLFHDNAVRIYRL
jgi:predicted TIM-barrel fold metal-dependent hydrolase